MKGLNLMIKPEVFLNQLQAEGLDFFVGVPDSLLKDFCACVEDNAEGHQHTITANEGNAVAMAVGYHLASGKSAVVYLQNSGLGNIINPITSIADKDVYQIPMLLMIGWRGEPGKKDEPQHIKQGRITVDQLNILGIPHLVVDANSNLNAVVSWAVEALRAHESPVALLVKKATFTEYKSARERPSGFHLSRESALSILLKFAKGSAVIATTGKTSREVFELRQANGEVQRDFLTVGGMGHTASIALGVAMSRPERKVICLDGDGSVLMHMGALPIIGASKAANLLHVVLNNGAHESVGGQPTVAKAMDFRAIANACGYAEYAAAGSEEEIIAAWHALESKPGPSLLEINIGTGSRGDLGRPTSSPIENKISFMSWLDEN